MEIVSYVADVSLICSILPLADFRLNCGWNWTLVLGYIPLGNN